MGNLIEGYFHLLKILVVLCLAGMVVLVFGNVALRYLFNTGISISEELSRWFFVWLTFLGALIGLREHAHLGMDSMVSRLSPTGKKVCLVIGQLLMLFSTWFITVGSWDQVLINTSVAAPASGLPMAILYAPGVVFGITAALIIAYELYRVLAGKVSDEDLVMVTESEELAEIHALQEEIEHQEHVHHKPTKSTKHEEVQP
ncbi:MAG: TRAP transporter small permease [Pseudogulbenkiania sp.]|nr:TRAP transporter small permease [Pseudogulbenkiania sp.]